MTSYARLNENGNLHLLRNKAKVDRRDRKNNVAVKVPDEVILEMRTLFEIDRKTYTQVMAAYPQYSKQYVRYVLNYILRANLRVIK